MAATISLQSAREALFRAPLAEFVAERKRLALELKTAGDKEGAKALAAIAKPGASAWAVNQLHWQDEAALEAMFSTAAKLRRGDLGATAAHREAIAKLRAQAAKHLEANGQAATEALLRRVTTTLAALAATGSFGPDRPGELVADRDPPGFEAASALASLPAKAAPAKPAEEKHAVAKHAPVHDLAKARREAEEKKKAEEARRREEEAKRLAAERARVTAALEKAREERKSSDHEVAAAKKALASAEAAAHTAQALEEKLAAQLKDLSGLA